LIDAFKRASFPNRWDWFKEFGRAYRLWLKRRGRRKLRKQLRKEGAAMR
jgi:hypothetical protein